MVRSRGVGVSEPQACTWPPLQEKTESEDRDSRAVPAEIDSFDQERSIFLMLTMGGFCFHLIGRTGSAAIA